MARGWKCRMSFEVEEGKVDEILNLLEQFNDQITDFRMTETDQMTKTYYQSKSPPTDRTLPPYKSDKDASL